MPHNKKGLNASATIWLHYTGAITDTHPDRPWEYNEYIRKDLHYALAKERDELRAEVARLTAENQRLQQCITDLAMTLNKTAEVQVAELMSENDRLRNALIEIATDPRDDSVCVGAGWNFYSDVVDYARQVLETLK